MRIKSITIELEPTEKEKTLERVPQPRMITYFDSRWTSNGTDAGKGLYPGEIRLIHAFEEARSRVGSI